MSSIIKNLSGMILKNDGPWGSHNGGSDNSNDGRRSQGGGNKGSDDFDEIFKKTQDLLKDLLNGGKGGGGKKSSGSKNTPPIKSVFGIFILAIVALWLASGIYKVNPDENAVILYFGKFIVTSGNY